MLCGLSVRLQEGLLRRTKRQELRECCAVCPRDFGMDWGMKGTRITRIAQITRILRYVWMEGRMKGRGATKN